jgi:hypothetical protein
MNQRSGGAGTKTFSVASGSLPAWLSLTREFERQSVRIRPIFQPRLHAKVLC